MGVSLKTVHIHVNSVIISITKFPTVIGFLHAYMYLSPKRCTIMWVSNYRYLFKAKTRKKDSIGYADLTVFHENLVRIFTDRYRTKICQ